ncbi:Crp/Fnr family transcriptional regulator [Anaerocolumna sp. AGMB13025]|uniref:Crp/Fnr family transcriptional regulator n=1 Tax=Anaerocolumna sp. AGMB13025 TaxID=3039116 RepID=UPI00241DF6A5|nr:Crp/Fnr family transcriptional regulator [Anaerocolumna sp. AGMB13025]WFR58436.1 Crp/Fnr family transcriptional regulator [Anaerocolumna sp. AGMB13025]
MLTDYDLKYIPKVLTFWDKLNEAQKNLVLNNISPVHYDKGARIHSGENDCIGVILIKKGELRIYILSDEGKEITLYRLRDGEICILSASCILDNITFDVHVDAEVDSEVLLIDSSLYQQLCRQNIYAENFTDKLVIDSFSDVMWAMEQILFMSFDKRLAIFLSDEITRNQSDNIELTHEQIAKYIGSAREVVSRMLKYFAQEGIVELSRRGVRVVDKKRLKELIL